MNILVGVASKHGSTREIAVGTGQELRAAGHEVQVLSIGEADNAAPYDAAVIGSAICMGKWLPEARQFIKRNKAKLLTMPVWLFSSGPLERNDQKPPTTPVRLGELLYATRARGHKIFIGSLDKNKLGMGERIVAGMVRAPEGDFRDWEAIRGWAHDVALALPTAAAVS